MSSSPDLPLRGRLGLAAVLVGLAWGLSRLPGVAAAGGGLALVVTAGIGLALGWMVYRRGGGAPPRLS